MVEPHMRRRKMNLGQERKVSKGAPHRRCPQTASSGGGGVKGAAKGDFLGGGAGGPSESPEM
jgi:hypothetical protein